jgi:spore coat protein U-like protein
MNKIKLIAGLVCLSTFNVVHAANSSAPMQVSATIESKCLVSSQDMLFGNVQLDSPSSLMPIPSNFNVQCTKDTAYSIYWDSGLNAASVGAERRLKHTTLNEYVTYKLSIGSDAVNPYIPVITGYGQGVGAGIIKQITGTINASQIAPAGNYTDIVTMTIEY